MLCPNCDGITNILGCQACGWKTGDPIPVHRLARNSQHPLIAGAEYARSAGVKQVPVLVENPPTVQQFTPRVAPGFNAPPTAPEAPAPVIEAQPETVAIPEIVSAAPEAPVEETATPDMGKSLTTTVQ